MKKYYVYTHTDQYGNIFYIGKGTGNRANNFTSRNEIWKNYVKNNNIEIKVNILSYFNDEKEAFEEEKRLLNDMYNPNYKLTNCIGCIPYKTLLQNPTYKLNIIGRLDISPFIISYAYYKTYYMFDISLLSIIEEEMYKTNIYNKKEIKFLHYLYRNQQRNKKEEEREKRKQNNKNFIQYNDHIYWEYIYK
jgi:hypothetical protein